MIQVKTIYSNRAKTVPGLIQNLARDQDDLGEAGQLLGDNMCISQPSWSIIMENSWLEAKLRTIKVELSSGRRILSTAVPLSHRSASNPSSESFGLVVWSQNKGRSTIAVGSDCRYPYHFDWFPFRLVQNEIISVKKKYIFTKFHLHFYIKYKWQWQLCI